MHPCVRVRRSSYRIETSSSCRLGLRAEFYVPDPLRSEARISLDLPDLCEESSMQDIPYDVSHVPIDYDEAVNVKEVNKKTSRKDDRRERREHRAALERDVSQLQKQLIIELNMRNALNRGFSRPLGSLPRIYASLPVETRDLLLEVAVLEEEIVSLEKQVIHLGREIEIEVMPVTDKETIWQNPNQNISPEKVEILDSPWISPKDSARIFYSKPSLSPRKSFDQKSNLSKPSFSAGKNTEDKSSSIKTASTPHRNFVGIDSSLKSSLSPKHFSESRRTSSLAPQKSQFHRSSSLPKESLRNTRDHKTRRLSLTENGLQEITLSPTHTVPFIPTKLSTPKEEESTPPTSPAPASPSGVGKNTCSQPPRIKTENGKPPITKNARFGRKDLVSNKVAPSAPRIVKAPSTPRPPGQDKDLHHTSRLPRQPLTHDSMSTRRTIRPSTAAFEQRINTQRSSLAPKFKSVSVNHDSGLHEHVDAEAGKDDIKTEDVPATDEIDGDYKFTHVSPDIVKINQLNCSPEKNGLEKGAGSGLLSEEVVKLLKTIHANMQERQLPPLVSDFDSSSQASNSTSLSSASPDDYEMRGGANINFRLNDCYTGSFMTKRNINMKYMRDCGEDADALDPYTYLSKGNISNRTDFHQRLMS